jgi:hypothetical protein
MSDQKRDPRKLDKFQILIENRQNKGVEPPNFSPEIRCDQTVFNFGKGGTSEALLPNAATPIFATHISHNAQNYHLAIAGSGNATQPRDPIKAGIPIAFNDTNKGEKVDISRWTITASPQF